MAPTDDQAGQYDTAAQEYEAGAASLHKTADMHDATAQLFSAGTPDRADMRNLAHQVRQAAAFAEQAAMHLRAAARVAMDAYERDHAPF